MEHWNYFEPKQNCSRAGCEGATKTYVENRLDTVMKTLIEKFNTDFGGQADWAITDSTKSGYIKNKPTIPAAQIQSNWTQTNSSSLDYIKNKPSLATVATTGDYGDLANVPAIPAAITKVSELINDSDYQTEDEVTAAITDALTDYTPSSGLGPVATSNSYNDLDNLPTVPVFTIQSTDPGAGGALAANNYIMVYEV